MQVIGELWNFSKCIDEILGKFNRVRRRKADTFHALDRRNIMDQQSQVRCRAVMHGPPIGIDVLPQQIDLPDPFFRQHGALGNHIIERPADFLSAGIGNNTESAIFATALHDRDKSTPTLSTGFGQVVKFLYLRKRNID